jgi:hypothetical protein
MTVKLFFDKDNYNNNRSYEKPVTKFIIYIYLISCTHLLFMTGNISEEDVLYFDNFFRWFDNVIGIFFKMSEIRFLVDFHQIVK